jgi:superfamily II DNA or RNA helicase
MSLLVPNTPDMRQGCHLERTYTTGSGITKSRSVLCCIEQDDDFARVPFFKGLKEAIECHDDTKWRLKETNPVAFSGVLNENQLAVEKEILDHVDRQRSCLLTCHTGFGKTVLLVALLTKLRQLHLPSMIVCASVTILNQWKTTLETFVQPPLTVNFWKTNTEPDGKTDVWLTSASSLGAHKGIKEVDVLICDEFHCLLSDRQIFSLLRVTPRLFLGATATPFRYDNMNPAFQLFFGTAQVLRKRDFEHAPHKLVVKKLMLDQPIPTILNKMGTLDYNAMIKVLDNSGRNDLIADIVAHFPDRKKWLVPVKEVEHAKEIHRIMLEKGIHATLFYGPMKTYDKTAQVLVATKQKVMVGFDDPEIDSILVASSVVAYFEQLMGRAMRTPDARPLIVDMVDNHAVFFKHWETRKQVYEDALAEITVMVAK